MNLKHMIITGLLIITGRNAQAQDLPASTDSLQDKAKTETVHHKTQKTDFEMHYIREKYEDLIETDTNNPNGICVLNLEQFNKDGAIDIKFVDKRDILEVSTYDPTYWVECRKGRTSFNFEEYFKCMSPDEQEYYNSASKIEQMKIRIDAERRHLDPKNYKAMLHPECPIRYFPKNKSQISRIGPNQADKTVLALELAFFACHPDSVLRNFATKYINVNDSTNKHCLEKAGKLLFDENGELFYGSDSWDKRVEALKYLHKVKAGNFCRNAKGRMLEARTAMHLSRTRNYYITKECAADFQKLDYEHNNLFQDGIFSFMNAVYLPLNPKNTVSSEIPPKKLSPTQEGRAREYWNHFGSAAKGMNIAESAKIAGYMEKFNYVTLKTVRQMLDLRPRCGILAQLYEKFKDAAQSKYSKSKTKIEKLSDSDILRTNLVKNKITVPMLYSQIKDINIHK